MSSRSANEILLEQECDRLKAEIDRHVRIYEQALKETKAKLDAAEARWQSLALVGREVVTADGSELAELRRDRERLADLAGLLAPLVRVANEYKDSAPDDMELRVSCCHLGSDFRLGDLRRIRAAVNNATGGANG